MEMRLVLALMVSTSTTVTAAFLQEDVCDVSILPNEPLLDSTIDNGLHKEPSIDVVRRAAKQFETEYISSSCCVRHRIDYHDGSEAEFNMFSVTTNSDDRPMFWLKRVGPGEEDSDFKLVQITAYAAGAIADENWLEDSEESSD